MDGAVEHSDSDSGESWTLLENNSVYADEAPEFIDEQTKHEAQHHERDEDTDGISIISDSDHEGPSPPPAEHVVFEKCDVQESIQSETDIPDYVHVSHLSNIDNDQDQITNEDFLGDTHAKHKTYVHRRNKRLSTVLNIIVLGSVITAAGVAIGHMWGAKHDCSMQTTSSVNKILSNLYKLQEENAYLRSKLKEFTFLNNNQMQHKVQSKHNKCRRVFEESLNSNDPKKVAKCVDDSYRNVDNLMDHLVKPKFEKEFVGDMDKLKTVYLQNKSWLDDEISRRMKIEEELLKKYNSEVNSVKEHKKDPAAQKNYLGPINSASKRPIEETLGNSANTVQKKVTYADSLLSEHSSKIKHDDKKYSTDNEKDWLTSKHNINQFDTPKQNIISNVEPIKDQQLNSDEGFINNFIESAHEIKNNPKEEYVIGDNWTEVKQKFRRNEERYGTDDKFFSDPKQNTNNKNQRKADNGYTKVQPNEHYSTDDLSSKYAQDKNNGKKEKRNNKQSSPMKSNDNRKQENVVSEEDIIKDNRYVVSKLKQSKKKNGFVNSNKKQKRKIKHDKWNSKGEFEQRYEAVEIPEDLLLNYPDQIKYFDSISFTNNADVTDRDWNSHKSDKYVQLKYNVENNQKKTGNAEQPSWFEKRALFRNEARKKYYEQFANTSPNNSSWYFRRMRKREQCRAKGDNSTIRKVYKDKKNYKVKH